VCVNYCVCLFFDLGGSISRNVREKGKYIHKKFSSDVMRPQNLLKAVLDVFLFFFILQKKEKNDECNLLAFTCVKKKSVKSDEIPPLPPLMSKMWKNKSFKKRTPKKQIEQKNYRILPFPPTNYYYYYTQF
jgi:hypothetical protein